MKKIIAILSFFMSSYSVFSGEITEDIAVAIRSGNAKEVSKYFSANVDLHILDNEDVYSKAQTEAILKDFYSKHPAKSFTIAHNGISKNGAQYAIGNLETSNGKFRVTFFLKKEADKLLIQQFRIEPQTD